MAAGPPAERHRYDYDGFGRTVALWRDEELAEAHGNRFSRKPVEGTGLVRYAYRW